MPVYYAVLSNGLILIMASLLNSKHDKFFIYSICAKLLIRKLSGTSKHFQPAFWGRGLNIGI